MKKVIYAIILVLLLFAISCESPTKLKFNELASVAKSSFNRDLLKEGGDFSIGYSNGNIRTSRVNLTWTETNDENFKLYRLTRDGDELRIFNDISQTSFTDSSLVENTFYNYEISVVANTGMVAQDTIAIKTAQWDAPSNLQANALSQTAVHITWDDNSDTEDYFEVVASESGVIVTSVVVDPNVTEAIITDLQFGSTYNFQINTSSRYESGFISSESLHFLMYNMSLGAPGNLHASINTDLSVTLAWNDYSNLETGFAIERKINAGDFIEIDEHPGINSEEFIDNDVLAYELGDILTYRIRAYNDYENSVQYSEYSNEFEIEVVEISDDLIYLSLTVDFDSEEAAWNIREQGTNNTVFPSLQTFDSPGETVLHQLELLPGGYYVHCIDYFGDGGISGTVYQGSNLLISWDSNDYNTNGYFEFYVSNN